MMNESPESKPGSKGGSNLCSVPSCTDNWEKLDNGNMLSGKQEFRSHAFSSTLQRLKSLLRGLGRKRILYWCSQGNIFVSSTALHGKPATNKWITLWNLCPQFILKLNLILNLYCPYFLERFEQRHSTLIAKWELVQKFSRRKRLVRMSDAKFWQTAHSLWTHSRKVSWTSEKVKTKNKGPQNLNQ